MIFFARELLKLSSARLASLQVLKNARNKDTLPVFL
jgi:hypothetical protein